VGLAVQGEQQAEFVIKLLSGGGPVASPAGRARMGYFRAGTRVCVRGAKPANGV